MQFSDTSTEQGLYQDACDRVQMDSNGFQIAAFTRWCNVWYRRAAVFIWKNQDAWRYDDTVNIGSGDQDDDAGLPVVTSTLTNSQKIYTLATNALKIRRVQVKDQAGIWQEVLQLDERKIRGGKQEFYKTDGRPQFYLLAGNKLQLFPAPDNGVSVTLTSGLQVFIDRDIDAFTASDTTQEPSLPIPWHQLLSIGPAWDFAKSNGLSVKADLEKDLLAQFPEMAEFVSGRQTHLKDPLVMRPRRYRST